MSNETERQFIPLYFDVITSKLFRSVSGDAMQLYWLLRRYVCRVRTGHSLAAFYIGGALAVSGYLGQYAKLFNTSEATISRRIKELEDHKLLVTYQKGREGSPSVWILGRVLHVEGSQWGVEVFFLDHDAVAQELDEQTQVAFDPTYAAEHIWPKMGKLDSTLSLLQVQMQARMQGSNREDIIEKTNSLPAKPDDEVDSVPVKEWEEVGPEEVGVQDNSGNRWKTIKHEFRAAEQPEWVPIKPMREVEYVPLDDDGFPEESKSPIVQHIESRGRKLTPNQQQKLASGVPFHNPQYPSPATLFTTNPLFRAYLDDKIAWANGGKDGSRRPTGNLVAAIRNYEQEKFGWLEFAQEHEEKRGETTTTPQPVYQPPIPEYSKEEMDAWLAPLADAPPPMGMRL